MTFFPSAALLLQIQGRKDCQSLTAAVFSLSLSLIQLITAAKKITEQNRRDAPALVYTLWDISNTCKAGGKMETHADNDVYYYSSHVLY